MNAFITVIISFVDLFNKILLWFCQVEPFLSAKCQSSKTKSFDWNAQFLLRSVYENSGAQHVTGKQKQDFYTALYNRYHMHATKA